MKSLTAPEHSFFHFPVLKPWMVHILALLIVLLMGAIVLVSRLDSQLGQSPVARPAPAADYLHKPPTH